VVLSSVLSCFLVMVLFHGLYEHVMNMSCRSRLIFTCRKATAVLGCQLSEAAQLYEVKHLQRVAAEALLLAGGLLQLSDAQVADVLQYCDGLPLALAVIKASLASAEAPHILGCINDSLTTKQPVNVMYAEDELLDKLKISIDNMSKHLRSAWLDIGVLFCDDPVAWKNLELVYGKEVMEQLQWRNLVSKVPAAYERQQPTVAVHHVLQTLAHKLCQPGTADFRIGPSSWPKVAGTLTGDDKVCEHE